MTLPSYYNQSVVGWKGFNPVACACMIGVSVGMAILDRVLMRHTLTQFSFIGCLYIYQHCEYVKDTLPDDWPNGNEVGAPRTKNSSQQKSRDGLALGVKLVIVLVSLIIVGMLVLFVIKKRRSGEEEPEKVTHRKTSMNAAKDPSQALQLEADGHAFADAVKSNVSTPHSDFDFEAAEGISVEVERPKTPTHFPANGGGGHGQLL